MQDSERPDASVFVVFGGAGDLAWRKLTPALFELSRRRSISSRFAIIAVDRAEQSSEGLRDHLREGVRQFSGTASHCDSSTGSGPGSGRADASDWNEFAKHIQYQQGDFTARETYTALADRCAKLEKEWGSKAQRIFYMATPPVMFGEIPKHLHDTGMSRDRERARLVVEKPIGHDLESTRALNHTLTGSFDESQIFRIDHYLGKETVQNILAFRFANPLFEPIWDRRYVDHVTVTVAEDVGIEHRGGYYDHAGALRDMVQNHLMQLLCLVAMEPPVSFDADEIRNKKVDVLHAVRPIPRDAVHEFAVRGQYSQGWIGGKRVPAYREEDGVSPDSETESFAALKLFVDNWRWQDVPFYLRTGKRLPRQASEISILFRTVPHRSFPKEATLEWQSSRLIMSIQPDEGIVLRFQAKQPGPQMLLRPVDMRFDYCESFGAPSPDAYVTLLWDVIKNDATLFMRADQVEAAWRLLTPVLDVWAASPPGDFPNYAAGTWGPETAQGLIAREGHSWPLPTRLAVTPREQGDER